MSDQFRNQMVALGVAQVVSETYGHIHAINALMAEGVSGDEFGIILHELEKKSINSSDLHNAVVDFQTMFIERM